jgi:hypothetical protein
MSMPATKASRRTKYHKKVRRRQKVKRAKLLKKREALRRAKQALESQRRAQMAPTGAPIMENESLELQPNLGNAPLDSASETPQEQLAAGEIADAITEPTDELDEEEVEGAAEVIATEPLIAEPTTEAPMQASPEHQELAITEPVENNG